MFGHGAPSPAEAPDQRLLQAATVDEHAFGRLVEPHRAVLHAHCYRMLGSLHDADDAVQDSLVRAWRSLGRFEAGRPLRPWLYKIATNVCLDALTKRPKRVLSLQDAPTAQAEQVSWIEPYPDETLVRQDELAAPDARYEQRESVELAFIAALQHLPARQRAVLILREVLGFSAQEVADALDTTVASVNSALQRARQTLADKLPDRSQQATLRSLGDDRVRGIVQSFVDAWGSRDVNAIVAMLVDDATFAMPPHPVWIHGRDAVVDFITSVPRPPLHAVLTRANGQPAVAWYIGDDRGRFTPASIEVLTVQDDKVVAITAFAMPELFERFGLPTELSAS